MKIHLMLLYKLKEQISCKCITIQRLDDIYFMAIKDLYNKIVTE